MLCCPFMLLVSISTQWCYCTRSSRGKLPSRHACCLGTSHLWFSHRAGRVSWQGIHRAPPSSCMVMQACFSLRFWVSGVLFGLCLWLAQRSVSQVMGLKAGASTLDCPVLLLSASVSFQKWLRDLLVEYSSRQQVLRPTAQGFLPGDSSWGWGSPTVFQIG